MDVRSVKLPVVAAATVVALLCAGGMAWRFFVPGDTGTGTVRQLTTQEKSEAQWMEQKAKESGGDFNRLSPEDQRRLFQTQGQMAPFLLKQAAQKAKK